MNRYLTTAAVLALMAAPAFAQREEHGDHPGGGGGHERGAQSAPAAAPAAPAAAPAAPAAAPAAPSAAPQPLRGNAAVNRAQANPAPANPAPAAQANLPASQARDNRGGVRNDNRPAFGNADVNRAQDNRGSDNRGPDHRFDNNRDNRFDNNRGPDNNHFGGNRTDFSGFRDFHRTFRAPQRFHAQAYNRPSGFSYRRWNYGETLPALFWAQQYWLNDFDSYDLPPPPRGAVWVRYGNDALLIDRYSGEIITAEYGVFY